MQEDLWGLSRVVIFSARTRPVSYSRLLDQEEIVEMEEMDDQGELELSDESVV